MKNKKEDAFDLQPKFALMLLFVIALVLYYCSLLGGGVLTLDDSSLMSHLLNHKMQLKEVFNPGWQKKYYRPIIDLSYLIDQRIYGADPFGFRFTNAITHAFNAMLLYLTARLLLWGDRRRNEIALFAATLFAIQPLAVESVSWISGRSDLIATFWSLLAILSYLCAKHYRRWYLLVPALLFALIAILSKEVAVAVPILIAVFELFYGRQFGYERGRYAIPLLGISVFAIVSYLILRSLVLSGGDMGLGMIAGNLQGKDFFPSLELFFASYGFYLKKAIFPFPLNFTINDINVPLYAPLGLLALILFAALLFFPEVRRYHFLFFWVFLGIGPAALISFTDIAWTRWAERYLYFSIPPLSIAVGMALFSFIDMATGWRRRTVIISITTLLLVLSFSTFKRSMMMNDNEAMWRDSYQKSPAFIGAAVGYGATLAKNNKFKEAEKVLKGALLLQGAKHQLFFNLGHISRSQGDYQKAEEYYYQALSEARADEKLVTVGPGFRKEILTAISSIEIKRAEETADEDSKRVHFLKGIETLIEAYNESPDNFLLYRIAKLYLFAEYEDKAEEYLRKFIGRWKDDHYKKAASKMLKRIEEGKK